MKLAEICINSLKEAMDLYYESLIKNLTIPSCVKKSMNNLIETVDNLEDINPYCEEFRACKDDFAKVMDTCNKSFEEGTTALNEFIRAEVFVETFDRALDENVSGLRVVVQLGENDIIEKINTDLLTKSYANQWIHTKALKILDVASKFPEFITNQEIFKETYQLLIKVKDSKKFAESVKYCGEILDMTTNGDKKLSTITEGSENISENITLFSNFFAKLLSLITFVDIFTEVFKYAK